MKPSFFRPATTLAALAIAAVGVVAVAEPASAAATRHDGAVRFNWGQELRERAATAIRTSRRSTASWLERRVRRRRAAEDR